MVRKLSLIHIWHATRHPYFGLMAGLAGALLAGWLFGIVDAVALGARPAFLWWLLLGLTAAVHYAVVYSGESLRHSHRRSRSQAADLPATEPAGPPAEHQQRQPVVAVSYTHLIAENKLDEAEAVAREAFSTLDKAASKNVVHPRNAARRKGRLMAALAEARATAGK